MSRYVKISLVLAALFVLLLSGLHLFANQRETRWNLDHVDGHKRLVVLVHGMPGRAEFEPAIELAREALPGSDLLVFNYDSSTLSNSSPYAIANTIEEVIHETHSNYSYGEIILVGHSMGGMLLRKAIV